MKNKFLIFSVFIIISINSLFGYANTAQPVKAVPFIMCQKSFVKQSEPFFYVVLSSLIKNNYKIDIQAIEYLFYSFNNLIKRILNGRKIK